VDGHIVLSRKLANRGHYPAIDVLESISRVMRDVAKPEQLSLRQQAIDVMADYRGAEDMISIGAYADGSDPGIDTAKRLMPEIDRFLRQDISQRMSCEDSLQRLKAVFEG
jgi:flagellum-specific ATP synthase